ncbi:type III-B CRISPR-associated protein Cas10/Cmr2, partial [Synechococcus sp. H60.3]|uniref:type III-B CRISPR-associated protein Cas10/Cmr2 n=1 Tax=Synechococcus sp. H60.3 TaxID=2967124 RepID=UPI0039C24005
MLHDPALKALHDASGRAKEGLWPNLAAMQGWISPKAEGSLLASVGDADLVASASDRAAIGHLPVAIDYQVADRGHSLGPGLEMSHLLSGRKRFWQLPEDKHRALQQASSRAEHLMQLEKKVIPDWIRQEEEDIQKVFWWFWRCFPQALVRELGDENLLLLPAETRLPDGSLWSHTSVVAALAGCLAGYDEPKFTRPFLASFTFNPIQELIKASRKMRDFWAGSWLLHYLSARLCWRLAEKYGPDCLLYPSLYGQPLIDAWLLERYPAFAEWIPQPSAHALLTAGFPNVILLLLPEERVEAAMQLAQQTLKEEWRHLAERALEHLQLERRWLVQLRPEDPTWEGWLEHQWQLYWAAAPLGSPQQRLKDTAILKSQEPVERDPWVSAQNRTYHLTGERQLFADAELKFLRISFWDPQKQQHRQGKPGLNVGSWWAAAVEATRRLQAACKQARDWQLPVAFGPRSTVSGLGPVVHPSPRDRWIGEGESRRLWQRQAGLFDGREQLNATETVKRALDKVLPELFPNLDEDKIAASYPDLTAGVAGYLKTHGRREQEHLEQACRAVEAIHPGIREVLREMRGKWGIPWADQQNLRYHPRLLNAGWLVEDLEVDAATQKRCRQEIEATLSRYYPSINPASWYVLAAGDGDDMGQWLRGEKMRPYYDYLPQPLQRLADGCKDTIGQVINSEELDQ